MGNRIVLDKDNELISNDPDVQIVDNNILKIQGENFTYTDNHNYCDRNGTCFILNKYEDKEWKICKDEDKKVVSIKPISNVGIPDYYLFI